MTITRKFVIGLVGIVMVLVGIAGLVLPVLPGWLLIIAGLALLRNEFGSADRAQAPQGRDGTHGPESDELAA